MSLLDQRDQVVASLAGSTAVIDYPELVQFVELHLNAAAGRAQAAIERSQERSAAIRGAIRKASGSLSLTWPTYHLTKVVHQRMSAHPSEYGLQVAPGVNTIRDEIRAMKEIPHFGTEAALSTGYAVGCATST